jgi:hypothetical protein
MKIEISLKPVLRAAAAVAALSTLIGTAWALDGRYATRDQVSGNSQSILLIHIQNAANSGNQPLLIQLCNDFQKAHGWKPGSCP